MCCTLQVRHEWASLRREISLLMRSSAMTTDSHTLDRLQMHTGERAPDSITSCFCLMCKGPHQGCCQVVTHLRCALLPSWCCCLACMFALLLICQPAKQAACTCLQVLLSYCLRQQQGGSFFAALDCMHWCDFMAQAYWAHQVSSSCRTTFRNTMSSSHICLLHCVVGACVTAVSAQAPCCTSPSAIRHRAAALRLHKRLCGLHKPWQRT